MLKNQVFPTFLHIGLSELSDFQSLDQLVVETLGVASVRSFVRPSVRSSVTLFLGNRSLLCYETLQLVRACRCEKNAKNLHFWAFWSKKADFGPFWPKRGHFLIFGEKAKTSLFSSFFVCFIFQYKKSENLNARIFGKMDTDERTNGGESKGPSTPSRDQKLDNSDVPIWRKVTEI